MTAAGEALIPASEIPGTLPELFLPPGFQSDEAQIVDGVPVWWVYEGDECHYDQLYVLTASETIAHAVTSYMMRTFEVDCDRVEIAESGWCVLATECGCTPERHGTHADRDEGCEGDCKHPELRPCNSDPVYGWMVDEATADTRGALPYMRVVLS